MTRRKWLQVSAGGAAAGGLFYGGCGAGVVREPVARASGEQALACERALCEPLLELGALAPSRHNVQPWLVRAHTATQWTVSIDPRRRLPGVDPRDRQAVIAIGAFLENISVAAPGFGFLADFELAGGGASLEVANVQLERRAERPVSMDAIRKRVTAASELSTDALSRADVAALSRNERISFFPASSPEGRSLTDATLSAGVRQVRRDEAQRELSRFIHWKDRDAERRRDGYTVASLGLSGMTAWYARNFLDETAVLSSDFRRRTVDRLREIVAAKAGWLVVFSPSDERAALLQAGLDFEKLFLSVRGRRIGLHPMSQALEETGYRAQVESALPGRGRVQLIARVGYLNDYPEPVSLRRPISEFVRAERA